MDSELQQWLEMLRSPNVDDRLVAVKTLQHMGDEEILAPLLEAVSLFTGTSHQDNETSRKASIISNLIATPPIA